MPGRADRGIGDIRRREGDDTGAASCARGEHAGVSHQMPTGRRQDAGKAAEERDRGKDQMRATVRPGSLQPIRYLARSGHRDALAGEGGPTAIAA